MQEENFSPIESLQLIKSMIKQAKNRFTENGFLYLLWGWLILFCSVGHFALIKLQWFTHPEIIWASCWIAIIFQVIYLSKSNRKEKVKTYSDEIINYIWVSFGVCMFVTGVILERLQYWDRLSAFYLLLYGIPTFLSGVVMKFTPLKIGGIICWSLAIISVYLSPLYGLLLLGAAVAAAGIIPGYMMRTKFNKENNEV